MHNEVKKDLASNWFKILQNAICNDINKIEKNKKNFKSTNWQKNKKKDEGVPIYKMSNNFRLRITNHRKIFFNYTRDISCFSCGHDLHDSYTVSGNRGKTRCVPCAVKYHIIDEVPEEIKEFV